MPFDALQRFKFKPGKTSIVLGVALAIGLLAALAARSYLSAQVEAIQARAKGKTVDVVVAKIDIAQGAKLSGENLAVRQVPAEYGHSIAVPPSSFDRIDGQTIAYPVKSGEMILWGLMANKKVPTFSARIEPGRRAITVAVDQINSISGMLEPEDLIDLVASLEHNGRRLIFPLLQQVKVIATGQRSVDDPKTGERQQFSTVTLDTTPEQAQDIISVRETGKLTALLRHPQDKANIKTTSYGLAFPTDLPGGFPQMRQGKRAIPILYGGSGANVPPEALKLAGNTSQSASAPPPLLNAAPQ